MKCKSRSELILLCLHTDPDRFLIQAPNPTDYKGMRTIGKDNFVFVK